MTGIEMSLLGLVIGLTGMGGGIFIGARDRVSRRECTLKHKGESATLTAVDRRLERIENKLDKYNGGKP